VLQIGSPNEVMNQPADEWIASFVGVETILSGKVIKKEGGTFVTSVNGGEIEAIGEVCLGETVVLCVRPEHVTLSSGIHWEPTSARNVFRGTVLKITSLGPYLRVHLYCGFPLVAYITHHSGQDLSLTEGKEVKISFKATAVTVIRKG